MRLIAARRPEYINEFHEDCRKESPPAATWPKTFCIADDADAIGDEAVKAHELESRNAVQKNALRAKIAAVRQFLIALLH